MRAWVAFLRAHAAVLERLNDELEAEQGMPLTWYDVLIQLQEQGGRLRMQELAHSIMFSKSGLTRLVDRMERAGLVRREACTEDGRGTFAAITAAGTRALARARPVHHAGIERHFGRLLSDEEADVLVASLPRITDALTTEPARASL